MKCNLCESQMSTANPPFTSSCGFTICSLCEEILKNHSKINCPKCNDPTDTFTYDTNIKLTNRSPCFFHKSKMMLSYCKIHNMGYCDECISHFNCQKNIHDFETTYKPEIISQILGQNDLNSFAGSKIDQFKENFTNKRAAIKEKIRSLKKCLAEFDRIYKRDQIQLYNIVELIRISKDNYDFKIFLANSWAFELITQFNTRFSSTEKMFNDEIKNLFYGLHGEEKTYNLTQQQIPDLCVKDYSIPSYLKCEDESQVIFKCEEKSTLESIYFGLPLVGGGSGLLSKLQLTSISLSGPNPKPPQEIDQKLEFSENRKYTEVKLNPPLTIEPKLNYELAYYYSGDETFKAYSATHPETFKYQMQLSNNNTIFKSRIFGLKLTKFK